MGTKTPTETAGDEDPGGVGDGEAPGVAETEMESFWPNWQLLLGWLYNSMDIKIAAQVTGYKTSHTLWGAIKDLFGVHSRSQEDYYRLQLQQTRKGAMKMAEYLNTMRSYTEFLALAGSPQSKPTITWVELQAELLTFEKRMEKLLTLKTSVAVNQLSVNFASVKTGGQNQRFNGNSLGSSQGKNQFFGNNRGGRGGRSRGGGRGTSKPTCQVCGKYGHSAVVCYNKYDNQFMGGPPEQNKNQNTTAYTATLDTVKDHA
ncbi:hypothetical protein LWI29_013659 [Acer saccharum]|uniref:Uncharacterized protein n=1 Tax=Acer saccharum TaxID=4024 RepID=A0AA39SSH6_ACESA|nr:hypothetical protein LWI29_013659 [Acer saccharum]